MVVELLESMMAPLRARERGQAKKVMLSTDERLEGALHRPVYLAAAAVVMIMLALVE